MLLLVLERLVLEKEVQGLAEIQRQGKKLPSTQEEHLVSRLVKHSKKQSGRFLLLMYNRVMVLRIRTIFFLILIGLSLWFLYLTRSILTPIVVAAIFAYIFNPLVNFFYHKIRLPRTLSILIIYSVLITLVVVFGVFITRQITNESSELRGYVQFAAEAARKEVNTLPGWLRPTVLETLTSLEKSKIFSTQYLFTFFPQAISRIVSVLIFLFAGFFFLKEGSTLMDKLLVYVPNDYKIDIEILLRRMTAVLGGYLRGQMFLVLLVSLALFIALSILGVRFALLLAIFSGFAEVIPIVGPILAASVAVLVVLISGVYNFSLNPLTAGVVVVLIYFILRQLQDYFVTPYVMGRITKLHPFIIFFAVLSGERLFGLLGILLAVPTAGIIKICLEFALDKINGQVKP